MIREELAKRNLPYPAAMRGEGRLSPEEWKNCRAELKELLCRYEYGALPAPPDALSAEIFEERADYCAGKAILRRVRLTVSLCGREFSFPFTYVLPRAEKPVPAVVFVNFRPDVPDEYLPTEEICDSGVAVASFYYEDVTADNGDFGSGLAGVWYQGWERAAGDPGKIAFWAWAAMRVLDWLRARPEIDPMRIAVAGHSRLGKTALFAGAMDERFCAAYSNNSGCGGAALSRGKVGESVARITEVFPFWFCPDFSGFAGREEALPFDQHALLALMAPRLLYVASAAEDGWADPASEFLGCAAASRAWELLGGQGLIAPDRLPQVGDTFHAGSIGYHLRAGPHSLSRYDWGRFLEFWLQK